MHVQANVISAFNVLHKHRICHGDHGVCRESGLDHLIYCLNPEALEESSVQELKWKIFDGADFRPDFCQRHPYRRQRPLLLQVNRRYQRIHLIADIGRTKITREWP